MLETFRSFLANEPHEGVPHCFEVLRALHHLYLLDLEEAGGHEVLQEGGLPTQQLLTYEVFVPLEQFVMSHLACYAPERQQADNWTHTTPVNNLLI